MPYYAVKVGKTPGVYKSWDECKVQVLGFPGAKFKKFPNAKDAYTYISDFKSDNSSDYKTICDVVSVSNDNNSNADVIILNPDSEFPQPINDLDGKQISCSEISLYTDGACSGNPGKGGYGYAVVINNSISLKGSGGLLATTNNQMELTAVIEGLKVIPHHYSVAVYSDSSYVVNAFAKDWISSWQRRNWVKSDGNPVANRELWEELVSLISMHPLVRFVWVKGHAGHKYNELCDRLAVKAINCLK